MIYKQKCILLVFICSISTHDIFFSRTMVSHLRKIPEVILLGNCSQTVKRLAVFSFLVRHPRGTFLHHNFVCAVLNDVFGIQARGGCACAGPYAQDLLGIDEDLAAKYESVLLEDRSVKFIVIIVWTNWFYFKIIFVLVDTIKYIL